VAGGGVINDDACECLVALAEDPVFYFTLPVVPTLMGWGAIRTITD